MLTSLNTQNHRLSRHLPGSRAEAPRGYSPIRYPLSGLAAAQHLTLRLSILSRPLPRLRPCLHPPPRPLPRSPPGLANQPRLVSLGERGGSEPGVLRAAGPLRLGLGLGLESLSSSSSSSDLANSSEVGRTWLISWRIVDSMCRRMTWKSPAHKIVNCRDGGRLRTARVTGTDRLRSFSCGLTGVTGPHLGSVEHHRFAGNLMVETRHKA